MTNHSASDHDRKDSLELLGEQDRVLAAIFAGWDKTSPDTTDANEAVELAHDHGTFGKLLIEHAAVRVAAKTDIARVLRHAGHDDLAEQLTAHLTEVRALLDRLDELARGVAPVGVGSSVEFADAAGALAAAIRADLRTEPIGLIPRVTSVLGRSRSQLRSARHIATHAPTHPGPTQRWYDDIPVLARIHARYDHLRGYPWAESYPFGDSSIAGRYDTLP